MWSFATGGPVRAGGKKDTYLISKDAFWFNFLSIIMKHPVFITHNLTE